jgi:hypothetical protein
LYDENLPDKVQSLFWLGDNGRGRYYSVRDLRQAIEKFNRKLEEVCAREGAGYIELSSLNGNAALFYDEYHFNRAGARQVAALVANGLSGLLAHESVASTEN